MQGDVTENFLYTMASMNELGLDYETANNLLQKLGSVRKVLDKYNE